MEINLKERMLTYEEAYNTKLPIRMPVIIRLDGRKFSKLTVEKPFDRKFSTAMEKTLTFILTNIQGIVLAYTQSDEFSLLFLPYKGKNTEPLFGNRVQKLVSILAGISSAYFSKYGLSEKLIYQVATFDARTFILPEEDVVNYFLYRYRDCIKNSINSYATSIFSHAEVQDQNQDALLNKLQENKTPWNDLHTIFKFGVFFSKDKANEPFSFTNSEELTTWVKTKITEYLTEGEKNES